MTARVTAEMAANVWKVLVKPGDQLTESDDVVILESMKMEIPVPAGVTGTVREVHVAEGEAVAEGQPLVSIDPA